MDVINMCMTVLIALYVVRRSLNILLTALFDLLPLNAAFWMLGMPLSHQ